MESFECSKSSSYSAEMKPNVAFLRTNVIFGLLLTGFILVFLFFWWPSASVRVTLCGTHHVYNATYPISAPTHLADGRIRFRIAVISDLDHNSVIGNTLTWRSYFLKGYVFVNGDGTFSFDWDANSTVLRSQISAKGRGTELSDLVVFNGKLYTVDDRTGIVFEILNDQLVPWILLSDGDGRQPKGFKSEWTSVKGDYLFVGGLGKEWTTGDGIILNTYPQWVKIIDTKGAVTHVDWRPYYNAMRHKAGIDYPGYMIHESGHWSEYHKKWFFLPRRASAKRYNEVSDERHGTNMLIICDAQFINIEIIRVGKITDPTHGFSAFRFIPGTQDQHIVALKSQEYEGTIASFIMVFDVRGHVLFKETKLPGSYKYEGIEFV